MATALVNGRVLTPRPVEGRAMALQGERIAGVVTVAELPASTLRATCGARPTRLRALLRQNRTPVGACWAP